MESILERITLYDIFGYLFPGAVFVIMVMAGGMWKGILECCAVNDNKTVLYLLFVLVSYLAGILFSEMSEWAQSLLKKPVSWLRKTRIGRKILKSDLQLEATAEFFQEPLVNALAKSGIGEKSEIRRKLQTEECIYYYRYIYGVIQRSQDHKRIHSYASACVMYRNLAVAILCGFIILILNHCVNVVVVAVCIAAIILLIVRSWHFKAKTNEYALIWFLEKYGEIE